MDNQYEHPHTEVLERLTRAGVQVWLTDTSEEDDTVRISSDCETYAVDGVPPQGAQVEAPTAITLVATPTPALSPDATAPLTRTPNEDCTGFERERQILLRLAPQLGPDPATGALGGRFECTPSGVSVGVPLSAGHSNSYSITKYATEKEARTGLDGEGEASSTFRGSPALHAVNTGNPMSQSTYDRQSLAWQRSRWVFKATSFDDTHLRIALNVFAASERMYDAAVELGLFPSGGPFATTPTATDTPVVRGSAPGVQIECIFYDGRVRPTEADEYVQIVNASRTGINLTAWRLVDGTDGTPSFRFPSYLLEPGARIRVCTDQVHSEWGGFSFGYGRPIWSNREPDEAWLYDANGQVISQISYPLGC